jgi:hypothetical protein
MAPPGPHAIVKRELLVRLLDAWLPSALHGPKRATYLDGFATGASVAAALGAVAEFADLLARRRLDMVLVGAADDLALTAEVARVRREVAAPAGVSMQIIPRPPDGRLPAVRMPVGGPLLAYLDASGPDRAGPDPAGFDLADLAALVTSGRAQVLLALDLPDGNEDEHREFVARYRQALGGVGPGLVATVELVSADGRTELMLFRTAVLRGLETFKDALWAVDEYAGVRYRDPNDPGHALLDISLTPHPGPLRRALLGHLAGTGARTVADLRRYALAETVYRAADVVPVLTAMVAAGAVRREPAKGRLTAEALISLP